MGHPNTKRHKANHGGYKGRPTKAEVKANLELWAMMKNEVVKEREKFDELDELFGDISDKISKVGTQLKLF